MLTYENISIPQATVIQNGLRSKVDMTQRGLYIKMSNEADISLNL